MNPVEESHSTEEDAPLLQLGRSLYERVFAPMKKTFVDKDEVIDVLSVCLVSCENAFLYGPPGTAKSALVHDLGRRLHGRVFDYLLTRFTEPNELFGPFDIRKLRDGELVTNTEGMLPEASLIFLDELLNANSAILNSLLMVLNERLFRRGRETRRLPTLMVVGASNHLPEDETLGALFDRFLLRVHCDGVADDRLGQVLEAGWQREFRSPDHADECFDVEEIRQLQASLGRVSLAPVRETYIDLVLRIRKAGIGVSDRRAVKLQRLIAASSLLCGRMEAAVSDLWILRYIWECEEQREILDAIVQEMLDRSATQNEPAAHPRALGNAAPDAESLAADIEQLVAQIARGELTAGEQAIVRDRLSLLSSRCQWVNGDKERQHLQHEIEQAWQKMRSIEGNKS